MPIFKDRPRGARPVFANLQRLQTQDDTQVGGDFVTPLEFNAKKFASAFVEKGNAVDAQKGPQRLLGTNFTADGWKTWKYPELTAAGKPHPKAGKLHIVSSRLKGGGKYVLMYRDLVVQTEVNRAYAERSRDLMEGEIRGDTVAGQDPDEDTGMLNRNRLRKAEPDSSDEEFEPPEIVEPSALPADGHITKKTKIVRN